MRRDRRDSDRERRPQEEFREATAGKHKGWLLTIEISQFHRTKAVCFEKYRHRLTLSLSSLSLQRNLPPVPD
jgi:hypothetical protein